VLLVCGDQEEQNNTATVRRYGVQEERSFKVAKLLKALVREIAERKHVREWEEATS